MRKWISTKGYFVVDLSSFVFQKPARWNIQSLTEGELYVIDNKYYQKIGQEIPRWKELEKLFIAKCFTVLEDGVLQHISMIADESYNQLFNFNKELFNQVPLQYIASMLGMTPETISRLRKKRWAELLDFCQEFALSKPLYHQFKGQCSQNQFY